ncbi:Uncharacterised protein [Mycobacteroides abscessus subsp. abscessus]|nr:Uncharacterised protein [Mycobacteroides abscessus subsp. abscessus]
MNDFPSPTAPHNPTFRGMGDWAMRIRRTTLTAARTHNDKALQNMRTQNKQRRSSRG